MVYLDVSSGCSACFKRALSINTRRPIASDCVRVLDVQHWVRRHARSALVLSELWQMPHAKRLVSQRLHFQMFALRPCPKDLILHKRRFRKLRTSSRATAGHGNDRVWKAWKAIKPAFHPSPTLWKSLRDSHITTASATGSVVTSSSQRQVQDLNSEP